MQRFTLSAFVILAGLCSGAVAADERLAGLKRAVVNTCVVGGNTGPGAPKNLKLVPKYCECVGVVYWEKVPKEEIDQMMSTGYAPSIDENKAKRMEQARAACKR